MNKHQIAFLKSIGVTQAVIDIMIATKEETDIDLSAQVAAFQASQRTLFENDSDLVKKIETAAIGKLTGVLDRKIKSTFNLPSELTKDKTVEELIAIAKTESTKGVDKPLQDLQNEVIALNGKIKEYEEVVIPAERSKVDSTISSFKKDNLLNKLISGKELRVPIDAALPSIQAYLGSKYDVELNEAGDDLIVYQKGTKLQVKSIDGTALLTADQIISTKLKENKFIKESNADDIDPATGKPKVIIVNDPNNGKTNQPKINIPHLSAAEVHLANMQKLDAEAAAKK